ncbi:hypothetical protein HID58_018070, partial [Brassica napus]
KIENNTRTELPYVAFQPKAIELCARKVSDDEKGSICLQVTYSFKMNKSTIFNILSAFEILETEVKGFTDPNHKIKIKWLVKMDHMVAALAKTFKCPVVDTIQALPQHQQVVVCSAAKAFRGSKKDRTIAEFCASVLTHLYAVK